jgi:hypothetical protein
MGAEDVVAKPPGPRFVLWPKGFVGGEARVARVVFVRDYENFLLLVRCDRDVRSAVVSRKPF